MRRIIRGVAVAATAAGLLLAGAGCGGCGYDEKQPITTIDGKNIISVGDFVYHYKRAVEMAPPQDKPVINTYDDAKDFLDDIITSRVLELEADALGYGKEKAFVKDVDNYRSNKLRENTRRKVMDAVKVTEAEILDYFNKNKEWRRASMIMCRDKGKVEKAYAELSAGQPWNEVVVKYSDSEQNKDRGGEIPEDVYYTGDNVSRAIYEAEVGKFTPVIAGEDGETWFIFRVDKKVPGQKEEYAQVKDKIRDAIKKYKGEVALRKLLTKLRKEADIKVDQEMYDAFIKGKTEDAKAKYNRKDPLAVISTVGGVPVYFDTWFEGAFIELRVNEKRMDTYKKENREEFERAMARRLKVFQDEALLEWDASRSGVAKDEDFIRDVNRYRAGKLVDTLYQKVFLPTVPDVTEENVKDYFERNKAQYQELERASVFVVALPDAAAARELYEKVKGGADMMAVVNEYFTAHPPAEEKGGPPPPGKTPLADMVTINKEPPAAGTPAGPEGGEPPIAAELRPRVFKLQAGALGELFKLKDGRTAFFKYLEYSPFVQHTLDEKEYYDRAKDEAYKEKVASPEVDRMCQAWFKSLRAKHKIEIDESGLKMAFKKVQKL